jgi:hypothetical protein
VVFTLIVFGGLVLLVGGLIAIGMWNPKRISEITGKADERRWAIQAQIEEGDVDEMVEAQNEGRRHRGKDEITEADMRARANAAQRASIERAERRGEETS